MLGFTVNKPMPSRNVAFKIKNSQEKEGMA